MDTSVQSITAHTANNDIRGLLSLDRWLCLVDGPTKVATIILVPHWKENIKMSDSNNKNGGKYFQSAYPSVSTKRFIVLFIRTKHSVRIVGVFPFFKLQNNT